MRPETFTITSLQETVLTQVDYFLFSTTTNVQKGLGIIYQHKFEAVQKTGGIAFFQFYSPHGFLVEVPIESLSISEYGVEYPHDAVDVIVRLTREVILMLSRPDIEFFSY